MKVRNIASTLVFGAFFIMFGSGCGAKQTPSNQLPAQPVVDLPAPNATLARSPDGSHFDLKNNGVFLATIPNSNEDDLKATVLGFNRDSLFVGVNPHDVGQGYILFKDGFYYNVYQVARVGGQVQSLTREGKALTAVSPDGTWLAWLEYGTTNNLYLKNTTDNSEKKFTLPNGYHQFGTMFFSPDSKKLAYAAAAGFPGRELGAVFVITMSTDSQVFVDKTAAPGTKYIVVTGWKTNDAPEYHTVDAGNGDASVK